MADQIDMNPKDQKNFFVTHINIRQSIFFLLLKLVILDYTWAKKPLEKWVEYIKEALFRPEFIIADSEIHNWIHTERPTEETIKKYIRLV